VRKAIKDTGRDQRFLRTVPREGFRFVGHLRADQPAPVPPQSSHLANPILSKARAGVADVVGCSLSFGVIYVTAVVVVSPSVSLCGHGTRLR
jgi:hypothetical protein